jgi:hypothetical protein
MGKKAQIIIRYVLGFILLGILILTYATAKRIIFEVCGIFISLFVACYPYMSCILILFNLSSRVDYAGIDSFGNVTKIKECFTNDFSNLKQLSIFIMLIIILNNSFILINLL